MNAAKDFTMGSMAILALALPAMIAGHYSATTNSFYQYYDLLPIAILLLSRNWAGIIFCFFYFVFVNLFISYLIIKTHFSFLGIEDFFALISMGRNAPAIYIRWAIFFLIILVFSFRLTLFCISKIMLKLPGTLGILLAFLILGRLAGEGYRPFYIYQLIAIKNTEWYKNREWKPRIEPFVGDYATAVWKNDIEKKAPLPKKIFLILNESWGVMKDEKINNELIEDLITNPNLEIIDSGKFKVVGATLDGELREMCQFSITNYNIDSMNFKQKKENIFLSCLPNLLKKNGFSTAGFSSGSGSIYADATWHALAGIQENYFFENLSNPEMCHSFYGACDTELVPLIKNFYQSQGRRFGFWLTLNTHYPYDLRDLKRNLLDCSKVGVNPISEPCRNLKLQRQFFAILNELSNSPEMAGVEVIVVGDHAPPIFDLSQKEKEAIFWPDYVSYLHFRIKP